MTSIEWVKNTDGSQGRTWNPIRGCTRVSPGCGGPGPHGGCYAEVIAGRFSGPGLPYEGLAEMRGGKARWTGKLAFVDAKLTEPLKVRKPTTWFVNSMSDLFHEAVPDAWIDRVFAVMALAPQHTFQVLTKRSARMRAYMTAAGVSSRWIDAGEGLPGIQHDNRVGVFAAARPLPNVWLGVSAEDQRRADERVPDLLATPAAVRFVSAEPLLGPVDFTALSTMQFRGAEVLNALTGDLRGMFGEPCGTRLPRLSWIIVGGESGPGARPMHPDWARQIRDACAAAGVAYLFKQWGAWGPVVDAGGAVRSEGAGSRGAAWEGDRWRTFERGAGHGEVFLLGKGRAGRLLDGVQHNGMPEVRRC